MFVSFIVLPVILPSFLGFIFTQLDLYVGNIRCIMDTRSVSPKLDTVQIEID